MKVTTTKPFVDTFKQENIMNKKIILGVFLATALAFFVAGSVFLAKKFFYNWNHDIIWEGERLANIRYFAGCALGSELINANDAFFSQEWNKLSVQYEFTVSEIDALIPACSGVVRNQDLLTVQKRASHSKRSLTEEEIQREIDRSLANTWVADKSNGRRQTEAERLEAERYLREDLKRECWDLQDQVRLSRFDCVDNVEQLKKDIANLEIYQKKFLDRGFSVLKK